MHKKPALKKYFYFLCFKVVVCLGICSSLFNTAQAQQTRFTINGQNASATQAVSVCINTPVTFANNSTGNATNPRWIFKGGSPATAIGNTVNNIVFSATGIDSATLIVTRGANEDTLQVPVRVEANNVTANFSSSPTDQCANIPVSFTNQSAGGPGLTYAWNFNDPNSGTANTSTQTNLTRRFIGTPGNNNQTFNVRLIARNNIGCADTINKDVTVKRVPGTQLGGSNPTVYEGKTTFRVCTSNPSGDVILINQSSTDGTNTNYQIKWGNGSPDFSGSSMTPQTRNFPVGIYNLSFIVTGGNGCIDTANYGVFVGSNPAVGLGNPGNTSICTGSTLTFPISSTESNPPGTVYSVVFNDLTNPVEFDHPAPASVTHRFDLTSCGTTSGTFPNSFQATITATNPCLSSQASVVPIYVSEKARAIIGIAPRDTVCTGMNVAVNDNSGNISFINGSSCSDGKRIWTITPATGFTLSGTLGNDNSFPLDPTLWTTGSAALNLNFTQPGVYTIKLRVGNPVCGRDSIIRTICVNPAPVAAFSLSQQTGCAPLTVNTTNTSNIPVCDTNTYQWSVNYSALAGCSPGTQNYTLLNGTTLGSAQPVFQFINPGTYTISLITRNALGECVSAQVSQTVTVKEKPNASFNAPASLCQFSGFSPVATINNCGGNTAATFAWQFPNGTPATSSVQSPGNILFNTNGDVTLSLSVTNECGTTVVTRPLTINPTPEVTIPPDTAICRGGQAGPFAFVATPNTAIINWTNNNPAIGLAASGSGSINAFTPNNAGAATITVTPRIGTCNGVAKSFTLTINPLPTAPGVSSPVNYCVGETSVPLTANPSPTFTLRWYTTASGGTAITAPTPSTAAPGTTNWWVSQVNPVTNCEGPRASIAVTVNPIPVIGNVSGNNPTTCAASNGFINITGLAPNQSYSVSYNRNGTPVTVSLSANGAGNLVISNLSAGIYDNIRVTGAGCPSQAAGPVSLSDPNPPATPTVGSNGPVCSGSTLNLNASSATPGAIVYTWSGPNNFSSSQQNPSIPNIGVIGTGTYSVTARLGNCTSPAGSVQVVVAPTPQVSGSSNSPVCSSNTINLSANSTTPGAVSFAWTGPNNFSSNSQNPSLSNVTLDSAGIYRVTATLGLCASLPVNVNVVVRPTPLIVSVLPTQPSSCTALNGSITLAGLNPSTAYQLTYQANGVPVSATLVSNASGNLVITGLGPGTYSNIVVTQNGCPSLPAGPVTLLPPNPPAAPVVSSNAPICLGSRLNLTATAIGGPGTFSWTGPNGFTSQQQNPFIPNATLAAAGTYTVTFTANGCISAPGTVTVQVLPNPSVANAGPDQQLCNNSTTTLAGNNAGNGTGTWTVLAPSTAVVAQINNPTATVSDLPQGTTTLVWTVSNNVCPATTDTVNIVNLPPVTQIISPLNSLICSGQVINFTGTAPTGGTGTYAYQWQESSNNITFNDITGGSNPGFDAAPNVTTYYRRLVSSGVCTSISDTATITVRDAIGNNTITGPASVCINTTAPQIVGSLPTGGGGNFAYQWQLSTDGGSTWNGIPAENGISLNPGILTQTTLYRRLVSTDLCQGPQAAQSNVITITVNPDARVTMAPTSLSGCAPFDITTALINLTHLPDQNSTYRWFINNNLVGTGLVFPGYTIAVNNDSAQLKVVAISPFGCLPDSATATFRTIANPAPAFTLSDSVGCGPMTISFTNNTPDKPNFSFLWDFGNGQTSTAADPPQVFFTRNPDFGDTLYTITMKATNGCDTLTVSEVLRVRAPAKAIISPDKVQGCSPALFTFTNNSRGSNATYTWDFGDGTPAVVTQDLVMKHTYNTGERRFFTVTLLTENSCGSDTARLNVLVSPNPIRLNLLVDANELNGCAPHTVRFINNTLGASTFRYNFGDGSPDVVSTRQFDTLFHTYAQIGSYTMQVTASSGCTDTTASRVIEVRTAPVAGLTLNRTEVCLGEPIQFTNRSSPGAGVQWRFGDGTGSGVNNPLKSFAAPGTYRVTILASTNFGQGFSCTDSASAIVIVRDTLPGSFTMDSTGNCAPFFTTFKTTLPTAVFTAWDFGDGNTATGDSVVHPFMAAGTYLVTMVSRDAGGCSYKAQRTVTVRGPSGQFIYTAPYSCFGQAVSFRALSANTSRYIFYPGNGDSISTTNGTISYTYPQPGSYQPRVVLVSGVCRSELIGRDSLKVDDVSSNFQFTSTPQCGSTVFQFNETGNTLFGIGSWQWQFGDGGTSSLANPIHAYTTAGTYNVRLLLTGLSGCRDSISKPVRVDLEKIPRGIIAGDTVACIGQTVSLLAQVQNADGPVQYTWNFGNGSTATGPQVVTSYNQGGSFNVSLITRTAFGCADTARSIFRVSAAPLVSAGADLRLCRGQNVTLRATGAVRYQWSPSFGLSCADCPDPMAQPIVNTTYVLTGYNALGCEASDTLNIAVAQPFVINYSNSDTICLGDTKQLNAGGAPRFVWTPAATLNSANIANPVASPTITTTYRVVGLDNFNCFSDTGYVTVEVGRIPTVDVGNGGTYVAGTRLTINPSLGNGPFARYTWEPSSGLSCADCPNPTVTIGTNITYTLTVTSPFGCSASDTLSYRVICDRGDQVYIPNAFSPDGDGINDVFMVRGKGLARVKSIRIFNRFGQVVFERTNIDANDPTNGWDGRVNGVPASPDVYIYTAELLCTGGAVYQEKGNVTLVR